MDSLICLVIALGAVYLAGKAFFGRQYTARRFADDLAIAALLIIAGFGAVYVVLMVLP